MEGYVITEEDKHESRFLCVGGQDISEEFFEKCNELMCKTKWNAKEKYFINCNISAGREEVLAFLFSRRADHPTFKKHYKQLCILQKVEEEGADQKLKKKMDSQWASEVAEGVLSGEISRDELREIAKSNTMMKRARKMKVAKR
jgi:hypothetical protein